MNDARLLEQLARTDRFPVDAPMLDAVPVPAIALREIERRIEMQTQQRPEVATPTSRNRKIGWLIAAAAAAVALVVAAAVWTTGGSGSEDSADAAVVTTAAAATPTTAAAPTTVATTVPAAPAVPPIEVIEALDAAIVAGDWEAALALYSQDATYSQIDDGFGFDFIRHGKNASGDELSEHAFNGPNRFESPFTTIYPSYSWTEGAGFTVFDALATVIMGDYAVGVTDFYSCEQTDDNTVVCDLVLEGHAFIEEVPPVTDTFTVVGGLITHQLYDTTMSRLEDPFGMRLDYLGYLEANYAESVDELFDSERLGSLVITPETVETHRDLIAEWRAQS